MDTDQIKYHKDLLQSSNINFLIGSGLSRPFLPTLGNIETLITELDDRGDIAPDTNKYLKASLFSKYFEKVMFPNKCILEKCAAADRQDTANNYSNFLKSLNKIIQKRGTTIVSKQCNLFTTNIDLFLEVAVEDLDLEFNDGFSGRINPNFSLSNYHRTITRCSHNFENESKIPVFNILKLHGSLNWRLHAGSIHCSFDTTLFDLIHKQSDECEFVTIEDADDLASIIAKVDTAKINTPKIDEYLRLYKQLPIINPSKRKFEETTLGLYYYELLRFLSNQLEKDNSVLYVMGFSMADEHIREIILRVAKSNPTLQIFIISFDNTAKAEIESYINNPDLHNLKYLLPPDGEVYSFDNINQGIFTTILNSIG